MVLVSVYEAAPGWVELRSRYDATLIATYKLVPGLRWVKERKVWMAPKHALPIVERLCEGHARFVIGARLHTSNPPMLHPGMLGNLRPYQIEGAQKLIDNRSFLLAFDMRTGKTRTAAVAGASLLAQGLIRTVGVLYPNAARHEWARQFREQTGLELVTFESTVCLPHAEWSYLASLPHLAIGMHYELDPRPGSEGGRAAEFRALLEARGTFAIVADEVHYLKNRKAGRTKFALELARSKNCGWRWGLTGTPMRNYPRDMWAMFDFLQPESMGSYSRYTARYADGHMGDFGWVDDGVTNSEELAERLKLTSMRVTRREVAQWLPKSDRAVVLCNMTAQQMKAYKKQEAALGPAALKAMNEGDSKNATAALKQLSALTTATKLSAMVGRITEHMDRGVKVIVFANFHETLESAIDAFVPENLERAAFVAGGWIPSEKRRAQIDAWKAHKGPAVLFANMLSSGVGIDLADAEVAVFVELTWVPADFLQAEARIQDVHLGKRTTPPLYEYLLVRGTIDEDMGVKLLNKLSAIERVVGGDAESRGVDSALRESGLVDGSNLTLANTDDDTVNGVLDALRERLFGDDTPDDDKLGESSDNADVEEDDDSTEDNDEAEEA